MEQVTTELARPHRVWLYRPRDLAGKTLSYFLTQGLATNQIHKAICEHPERASENRRHGCLKSCLFVVRGERLW
jgi:hypothetical protein